MILISQADRDARFKLFNNLSARFLKNDPDWGLSREEYNDWFYLRLFFFEEYVESKLKPWRQQFK